MKKFKYRYDTDLTYVPTHGTGNVELFPGNYAMPVNEFNENIKLIAIFHF